jgi:hypothetical protein
MVYTGEDALVAGGHHISVDNMAATLVFQAHEPCSSHYVTNNKH